MEAGYGLTESAFKPNEGDETLAVVFSKEPMQNKEKSLAKGSPVFDEVDFITINVPGDKDLQIHRKATEHDKNRFPVHWERYLARVDQEITSGMPLAEWPQVTRSQVEELKYYKVFTVEQLAAMSDGNLQNMMGGVPLKQKAAEFLTQSTSNEELQKQLKAQQEQIKQLIAAQTDEPKRKRRTKAEMEAAQE